MKRALSAAPWRRDETRHPRTLLTSPGPERCCAGPPQNMDRATLATERAAIEMESASKEIEKAAIKFQGDCDRTVPEIVAASREFQELVRGPPRSKTLHPKDIPSTLDMNYVNCKTSQKTWPMARRSGSACSVCVMSEGCGPCLVLDAQKSWVRALWTVP